MVDQKSETAASLGIKMEIDSSPSSVEQAAKQPKTLSAQTLKANSITLDPSSTHHSADSSTGTFMAPIAETKAEMVQQMLQGIADLEVFYPDLDDHIITTEDMTLDEWLKYPTATRQQWRDYYDHRKENRKNGFIRENADSLINDVLMRALFDTSKTLAKVIPSALDPLASEPERSRENLAKSLTSYEPHSSSSSSSAVPKVAATTTTSTSSSSKDTTPNREVFSKPEDAPTERLRLDYVGRNVNRRRKNALIIERETKIEEIICNDSKGIVCGLSTRSRMRRPGLMKVTQPTKGNSEMKFIVYADHGA